MKKLFIGMVMILFSFQSFSQQVYWNCFNIVVESPTEFATLLDAFMKTESGKSVTPAALSEWRNSHSGVAATHQLCFFSPDPVELESVRSKFNNAQAGYFRGRIENNTTIESSVLGQSLIADPTKFNLPYGVIYAVSVEDPVAYGTAFTKMVNSVNYDGAIELHEALAGGEPGITHYVVVRDKSYSSWIKQRNPIAQSKAFQEFLAATRSITNSELTEVFTNQLLVQNNLSLIHI